MSAQTRTPRSVDMTDASTWIPPGFEPVPVYPCSAPPSADEPTLRLSAALESLGLCTAAWCVRHDATGAREAIATELAPVPLNILAIAALTRAVEAWSCGDDKNCAKQLDAFDALTSGSTGS